MRYISGMWILLACSGITTVPDKTDSLPPLTSFVLPGGGNASAHFHLARTVCRRAERLLVALGEHEDLGELPVVYLNRLSDALFVFGRWAAMKDGQPEPLWQPSTT